MTHDRLSRIARSLLPFIVVFASAVGADANHAHVPLDLHLFVDYSLPLLPNREEDSLRLVEALNEVRQQLIVRARSVPKNGRVDYVRVFLFADDVAVGGWGATARDAQFDWRWQELIDGIRAPRSASSDPIAKGLNRNLTDFRSVFGRLKRPNDGTFGHPTAMVVTNGVHDTGQKRKCDQYYLISGPERDQLRAAIESIELRTAFLNTPCALVDGYPIHPFASAWRGLTNRHLELFLSRDAGQPLKGVHNIVVDALHFLEAEVVLATPEAATTFGRKHLVWKIHVGARLPASFRLCFDSKSIQLTGATDVRLEFGRDVHLDAPANRVTTEGATTCQVFDVTSDVRDVEVRMSLASSKISEIGSQAISGSIRALVSTPHQLYPDTLPLVFGYRLPLFTRWLLDDKFAFAAMGGLLISCLALVLAGLHSRYGFWALGWDVDCKVYPPREPGKAPPPPWTSPPRPEDFSLWSGFLISPCSLVKRAGGRESDVRLSPADAIRCWPVSESRLAVIGTRKSSIAFLSATPSTRFDMSRRQLIGVEGWQQPLWVLQAGRRGPTMTPVGIMLEWKRRDGSLEWLKRAMTIGPVTFLRRGAWILAIVSAVSLGVAASIASWYGLWREWAGFVSSAFTLAAAVTTVHWPKLGHLLHIHGLLERFSDFPELLTELHRD